ncbi:MAG: DNA mismatch repair protein MutS [Spirochaetota bacterium]|nr:DNA mismatch repair protein MutS [Spirochaetota bacterium]
MKNSNSYNPRVEYDKRILKFTNLLNNLTKKFIIISRLRLTVFLIGTGSSILLIIYGYPIWGSVLLSITLIIFIILILKHNNISEKQKITSILIKINSDSIDRLNSKWTEFLDNGEDFINPDHPFSNDLDIFGHASLFQWTNVTNTYYGRIHLKNLLSKPVKNAKKILQRQQAITELSQKINWRQRFQAEGMKVTEEIHDPTDLLKWAEDKDKLINKNAVIYFVRILPIFTILSIVLTFFVPWKLYFIPFILILLQLLFIAIQNKKINSIFQLANSNKDIIKTYQGLFEIIEKENFSSEYIQELYENLLSVKHKPASQYIKKLEDIVDYINLRLSSIHFIVNTITLWDYHCAISLDKWKEEVGPELKKWLHTIGEIESLSSLAIIAYNNPSWALPIFTEEKNVFSSANIGHPLILEGIRVYNSISISDSGRILIITGSNMSGKSTLLRTIGIALVLAYSGSPVCGESLHCSIMDIYTSMRNNDNLEKNISLFYAELLRIKMIIEASKKDKPIVFLLDEIFSGTNTRDRRIGAEAVIKELSANDIIGLISTHDLELTALENNNPNLKNYFFTETYNNNEIIFDYTLREGVSNTSNAIYLMKMIGIDIKDD